MNNFGKKKSFLSSNGIEPKGTCNCGAACGAICTCSCSSEFLSSYNTRLTTGNSRFDAYKLRSPGP
ncbi:MULTISPECIES: hypothetical protein [Clostridia]|jgi:hypothetical protein|uniref:hypothetical protein n=1 Tax=Clostridia TaxID=186801 RepID=UPI0011C23C65|nr:MULTISPECIES: hypothetical protein [Clostridia]